LEPLETRCLRSAGRLDPHFGLGGKVATDFKAPLADSEVAAVVVQPDGKWWSPGLPTLASP
jgi:hypothetical protein